MSFPHYSNLPLGGDFLLISFYSNSWLNLKINERQNQKARSLNALINYSKRIAVYFLKEIIEILSLHHDGSPHIADGIINSHFLSV